MGEITGRIYCGLYHHNFFKTSLSGRHGAGQFRRDPAVAEGFRVSALKADEVRR
jgi:hypothetical protein